MRITRDLPLLCLALLLAGPATAEAHLVSARFGDFYGGALHPLTAFEHTLPWVALGILAGMQDPRWARWMLLAFPVGLGVGTSLALIIHQEPLVSTLNIGSFVLVGTLIAAAWSLPAPLLFGLGALLGLTHGYENGVAMTNDTNVLLFVTGVATIGYIVVTLVTALTVTFLRSHASWRRIGLRAFGSWIAAIGIMLMGFRLAAR